MFTAVFTTVVLMSGIGTASDWRRKAGLDVRLCTVKTGPLKHFLMSMCLPNQLLGKFSLPPYADIILRSSESHDFQVQKSYVVDSSPILGVRISVATRNGAGLEGKLRSTNCLMNIE